MSRLIDALIELGRRVNPTEPPIGKTVEDVIGGITLNPAISFDYDEPMVVRIVDGTPIYRVYGIKDLTTFSGGVATHTVEYDPSEKIVIGCGCSANVIFGSSPQTSIVTSGTYEDLTVEAGITGGNGNNNISFKVTDKKDVPNATVGILRYWYEYEEVSE